MRASTSITTVLGVIKSRANKHLQDDPYSECRICTSGFLLVAGFDHELRISC